MKRLFTNRWLALLIAVACATGVAAQQAQVTTPVKTGLILGRVVDGGTGKPIGGVAVTLSGAPVAPGAGLPNNPGVVPGVTSPTRVLTNGEGYFVFYELPEGAFSISATKSGFLSGAYGRRSPSGGSMPLRLTAGERKGDVSIPLWKYGAIGGAVVDERGEPLIGVQVRVLRRTLVAGSYRLNQTGNMPSTDDRGVYRIASLEPGDYVAAVVTTIATVPTSVFEQYTTARSSGNFETLRDIDVSISSSGVRVGSFMVQSGAQGPGGFSSGPAAILPLTDRGPLFVYPSVYYPSAATPALAGVITVRSGEERANIDFQLKPVPSVSVSGTLVSPGGPAAHANVQLLAAGSESLMREYSFEAAATVSDAAGAFTFLGVTPGQYLIRVVQPPARPVSTSSGNMTVIQTGSGSISSGGGPAIQPPIPMEPTFWAAQPVSVGESDVSGVAVTLRTGARIGGRVEFDGTAAKPAPERLQMMSVSVESSDGRQLGGSMSSLTIRQARFDANGQLQSYQQPAGSYILRPGSAGPGWTLASAMLNGVDVSAAPFELGGEDVTVVVRYTDHPSELSGTVRDSQGQSDTSAVVLVFPADSRAWTGYGMSLRRFQTSRATDTGSFRMVGLADGDYLAAAVREEFVSEWRDPAFLKKLAPTATRVTIADGQKAWLDLKVSAVR